MVEKRFTKISQLRAPRRGINIRALVLEKGKTREGISRKTGMPYRLAEIVLGDESGTIRATLWGDAIDRVHEGGTYEFYNVSTSMFRNTLRVNIGARTRIVESETPISPESIKRRSRGRA